MLYIFMLSDVIHTVASLSFTVFNVVFLSVMLSVVMLNDDILSAIILSVIMLSVVRLNVVAPSIDFQLLLTDDQKKITTMGQCRKTF